MSTRHARTPSYSVNQYGDSSTLVLLYVATLPWEFFKFGSFTATQFSGILLILRWIFRGNRQKPGLLENSLLLFVLWNWFTSFWSFDRLSSISGSVSITALAISTIAILNLYQGDRTKLIGVYGLSSSLMAFVLIRFGEQFRIGERLTWGDIDQNAISLNLAIGFVSTIFLSTFFLINGRHDLAGLWMLVAVPIYWATILLGSRTGFVALHVSVLAAVLLNIRNGRKLAITLLLFSILATVIQIQEKIPARLLEFINNPTIQDTGRSNIVDRYLSARNEWWLQGIGVAADARFLEFNNGLYANAHSLFWKTWIELGIIGLLTLASILYFAFKRALRSRFKGFLICSFPTLFLFAYTLGLSTSNVFWLILALAGMKEESLGKK